MSDRKNALWRKILDLNETVWGRKFYQGAIEDWLENFKADEQERLHALYLLSCFMFFAKREREELLKALYRDLFKYPIVEEIRQKHGDTTEATLLRKAFLAERAQTRFTAPGPISGSGSHLTFDFRKINQLPKTLLLASDTLLRDDGRLRHPEVRRYIFIDDFCGGGHQVLEETEQVVRAMRREDPTIMLYYFVLLGASQGLAHVRESRRFDRVAAVMELDASFECFGSMSRYFSEEVTETGIQKEFAERMCRTYGEKLEKHYPLGRGDGQLLIGFEHNTPNNTLPIFWSKKGQWNAIFPRRS